MATLTICQICESVHKLNNYRTYLVVLENGYDPLMSALDWAKKEVSIGIRSLAGNLPFRRNCSQGLVSLDSRIHCSL